MGSKQCGWPVPAGAFLAPAGFECNGVGLSPRSPVIGNPRVVVKFGRGEDPLESKGGSPSGGEGSKDFSPNHLPAGPGGCPRGLATGFGFFFACVGLKQCGWPVPAGAFLAPAGFGSNGAGLSPRSPVVGDPRMVVKFGRGEDSLESKGGLPSGGEGSKDFSPNYLPAGSDFGYPRVLATGFGFFFCLRGARFPGVRGRWVLDWGCGERRKIVPSVIAAGPGFRVPAGADH